MDGVTSAALAGAIAGAAVALPLGAIGVLLVQEAISTGWRTAAAGGLGVGVVDLSYAALAVLAGASVSRALAGHEATVHLVGAALLIAVAIRGLLGVRSAVRMARTPTEHPVAITAGTGAGSGNGNGTGTDGEAPTVPPSAPPPLRVAARFVTLTAVNPLTAIYFVALAAGSGDPVRDPQRAVAFLAGVFVASLTWQLLLVTMGWLVGARLGARARVVTGLLGYLVVLGYAVRMVASAG